jgi:branched-chain amino acid transport system substrate-binding protein
VDRQDADKASAQNGNAQRENERKGKAGPDRRKFLRIAAGTAGTVAIGGLGLGYSGCSSKGNTIRIVSSLPRTGSAKGQTDTIVNGIKLAIEESSEIAGMKIQFSDMDDATTSAGQWDAGKEADNAREAAADKNVMAFIGPYNSGAAKVSMPILNEAGLIQVSPAATWPGLTKKVPGDEKSGEPDIYRKSGTFTFCRVCPTDFVQGPLSAVFAKDVLGVKQVYILDDKELYGAGIAGLFEKKCGELGVKVLGHQSIDPKQPNFKTLMAQIAALKPDMLYFGGTSQSGGPQIALDMKGEGLSCPLMVPDGCYEEAFITGAGAETLNGRCYATIGGKDPSELTGAGAEFVKRYKEKFGTNPEAYAVYGYESAKVVLEAIKKVGKKEREEIRKAVLATKDFTAGAIGKWGFDADGDTTLKVLTISKVEGGTFKPVKSITE